MKRWLQSRHLPLLATLLVLVVLFGTASFLYPKFLSGRVILNLFGDNAALGIIAVGMTLVILSGGIDLSVGAVVAFTTILMATLVGKHSWHPATAGALSLVLGTSFGLCMGALIHHYELPPFLVTLGGMFFARGMAFVVSQESQGIVHAWYGALQQMALPLPGTGLSVRVPALIFLAMFTSGVVLAHATRFGRNVYAVGGSESSARLMGLPVGFTKVAVYGLNGAAAALAGIVVTIDMGSGNPAMGFGLELDAIAAAVIGGTLLSGGVGTMAGTLAGVLIFGTIQTALNFDGRLNSWWLRIAVGLLLLLFILLQRFVTHATAANKSG